MVMKKNNPLYKNQGIHVISSIFTVNKGEVKILLINRTNKPYKGYWALPSGALYNNELLKDGAERELKEKTGLTNVDLEFISIFDGLKRSKIMRMFGASFIGIVDSSKINIINKTSKTSNADWFKIDTIPNLAYDHNEIILKSLEALKEKIVSTNILKSLFPDGFTMPELQKVYETILNKSFDRRNFRKKLISLDLIEDTNKKVIFEGKKPAKLYKFKDKIVNKNVF